MSATGVFGREFDSRVLEALKSTALQVFGGEVVWSAPRLLHGYVAVKGRARDFKRLDAVKYIANAGLGDDIYLHRMEIYLYEAEFNEIREWMDIKLPAIARALKKPSETGVSGIDLLRMTGNKLLVEVADILEKAFRGEHTLKDLIRYFDIMFKIYTIDARLFESLVGESDGNVVRSFRMKYENVWKPLLDRFGDKVFGVRSINIGLVIGAEKVERERRLYGKVIRSRAYNVKREYGVLLLPGKNMDVIDRNTASKYYVMLLKELKKIVSETLENKQ